MKPKGVSPDADGCRELDIAAGFSLTCSSTAHDGLGFLVTATFLEPPTGGFPGDIITPPRAPHTTGGCAILSTLAKIQRTSAYNVSPAFLN